MRSQSGVVLLEALVGIVIFSIGVLGIVGLQAAATRNVTEQLARNNATELAESYITQIRIAKSMAIANWALSYGTNGGTNGAALTSWYTNSVENGAYGLPGAIAPTVTITGPFGLADPSAFPAAYVTQMDYYSVQVTLRWRAPSSTEVRSITINTQV